ncbi:hypothetical protein ACVW07_001291 [Cellulomonas sp. URHB0016]
MSVVVEGPWVDRRRPARVEAIDPVVGRHAAAGPSPEVVALVAVPRDVASRTDRACGDPSVHPARHARDGSCPGAAEVEPLPLVRELESVVDRMSTYGPLLALQSDLRALLGAWAAALVRLHRTPVTLATPVAEVPWVLTEPLPAWLGDLPVETGPIWAVRVHPGVLQALRRTLAGWTAAQWTHGDPTGDEVVVTRRHGTTRATLLGAAHHDEAEQEPPAGQPRSGMGDPRWDVATVLDWLSIALGPALDPAWHVDPVAMFLDEYHALGGRAVPTRAMAVARTVATAVEWSAQLALAGPDGPDERAWLSGLWTRPLELAGRRRSLS